MEELPEGTQNEYNPNINRIRPSPHEPDSEAPSRRTTGDGAGRAGAVPAGVPHCLSCSTSGPFRPALSDLGLCLAGLDSAAALVLCLSCSSCLAGLAAASKGAQLSFQVSGCRHADLSSGAGWAAQLRHCQGTGRHDARAKGGAAAAEGHATGERGKGLELSCACEREWACIASKALMLPSLLDGQHQERAHVLLHMYSALHDTICICARMYVLPAVEQ